MCNMRARASVHKMFASGSGGFGWRAHHTHPSTEIPRVCARVAVRALAFE